MQAFNGELIAIYITPARLGAMQRVESAIAEAGSGLVGDRYYRPGGSTLSKVPGEITLIEAEAIQDVVDDYELTFDASQSRRNLVTRGVPLNHLVRREFQVGEVRLVGIELCEPCAHLEKLSVRGIKKALIHRGGLRTRIVTGGVLREGDRIELAK